MKFLQFNETLPHVREIVEKILIDHFNSTPNKETHVLLDNSENILIGTYTIDKQESIFWLTNIFVVDRFRGRGLARKMVKRAVEEEECLLVRCAEPVYFSIFLDNGFRFLTSTQGTPTDEAIFKTN